MELLCKHRGSQTPHFAHGLCRECHGDVILYSFSTLECFIVVFILSHRCVCWGSLLRFLVDFREDPILLLSSVLRGRGWPKNLLLRRPKLQILLVCLTQGSSFVFNIFYWLPCLRHKNKLHLRHTYPAACVYHFCKTVTAKLVGVSVPQLVSWKRKLLI